MLTIPVVRTVMCLFVFVCLTAALNTPFAQAVTAPGIYACGGSVEKQVWAIWDATMKNHFSKQLIERELFEQGDTYSLYNFQTNIQSLTAMAMRCERRERINEITALVERTYSALAHNSLSGDKQWICRGGAVCNSTNKLIGKEVMLTSVQFLGLASQLANWLATRPGQLTPTETRFVRKTTEVALEHLLRWNKELESDVNFRLKAVPSDVKDGSPRFFYTDRLLWLLGVHADISGILDSSFGKRHLSDLREPEKQILLKRYISQLLQLFLKRVTLESSISKKGNKVITADIDRGFWRLYADNSYAGYTSAVKPVICQKEQNGAKRLKVLVPKQNIPIVNNVGWDISHASRLVPVLDSVTRNRAAIARSYAIPDVEIPDPKLIEAFANRLVANIWNGDREYPLFTNYWSGANGWYRVAYDNGTGQCREGSPPFGLSSSFPTGGYVSWSRYAPMLGALGQKIYTLSSRTDERSKRFIETYYPGLGKKASNMSRALNETMFLPTLVGNTP